MSLIKRMAVTLPAGPAIADSVARVSWAVDNGYQDAWFSDGGAPDALTTAAALGSVSDHIRIGVAVTPVFTRTPAVLAATAYSLGQILQGGFVMGLGSSSQTMMTGWHGLSMDKPLSRVKNTAIMVRSMLKGEKSDFDLAGLSSHGYRQFPLPEVSVPPLYLAALRPKMIEMAAEIGDGVIFNLWPKRALPKMMEHVRIGAERAGKDWKEVEVVNRAMVLVTNDKAEGRRLFRAAFAPYYANPVYNKFLAWAGYEDAADTITEGWAAKDRTKTSAALSDELVDEIAIIGTADECQQRILAHAQMGIHTHIIAPLGDPGSSGMQRTFEAFSAQNFSLR
ncbi:MAG: LLM class flavin-dependent oxidoreductase [Pseudomonadales bacterium]|nr:LLM class flavin-dependent oxidoreductase [Pseudomonadales bacterium]